VSGLYLRAELASTLRHRSPEATTRSRTRTSCNHTAEWLVLTLLKTGRYDLPVPLSRSARLIRRTQIVQQVRNWWKAHRSTVLASAQFVLEGVEKGLDGMPIPGPKAAIGAFAGVVKAVRVSSFLPSTFTQDTHVVQTLDENHASVKEITEKVEELTGALAQFMVPTLPDITTASVSEDMKIRVEEFNAYAQSCFRLLCPLTSYRRLTKIKTSAGAHPTTKKNVLLRLADAERVSEELKDAWTKIQVEYLHLIVSQLCLGMQPCVLTRLRRL
jgi:hypothetical protein